MSRRDEKYINENEGSIRNSVLASLREKELKKAS